MSVDTAAPAKLKVEILYVGVTRAVAYHPHERARSLYHESYLAFEIPEPEREQLELYLPDNTTLVNPDLTVEEAGVKPHTSLIMRARSGGGCA
jgi:hypothetical protein